MSDQPVRASYSAGENKVAQHLTEALSHFIGLPTATIEEKEAFAQACLDMKMQLIRQAIRRESQKPRITTHVHNTISVNGNASPDAIDRAARMGLTRID